MNNTDLCVACRAGDMQGVETILGRGEVDLNSVDQYVATPLMYDMHCNQASIVTRLLSIPHTRLDCTNDYGWTALHCACSMHNTASMIALFGQDRRCSPAILNMRNSDGMTAVMLAVYNGHLACVKEMDKLEWTNFRTNNAVGDTLVDVVARKSSNEDMLQYLLARKKESEDFDRHGSLLCGKIQ